MPAWLDIQGLCAAHCIYKLLLSTAPFKNPCTGALIIQLLRPMCVTDNRIRAIKTPVVSSCCKSLIGCNDCCDWWFIGSCRCAKAQSAAVTLDAMDKLMRMVRQHFSDATATNFNWRRWVGVLNYSTTKLFTPLSATIIWTCRCNLLHTAITFHHFFTVSLWPENLHFQKILSSVSVRRTHLMALDGSPENN